MSEEKTVNKGRWWMSEEKTVDTGRCWTPRQQHEYTEVPSQLVSVPDHQPAIPFTSQDVTVNTPCTKTTTRLAGGFLTSLNMAAEHRTG